MKTLALLMIISLGIACKEPIHVTSHLDDRSATSGTLGSVKASNGLPPKDTLDRKTDTVKVRKDVQKEY